MLATACRILTLSGVELDVPSPNVTSTVTSAVDCAIMLTSVTICSVNDHVSPGFIVTELPAAGEASYSPAVNSDGPKLHKFGWPETGVMLLSPFAGASAVGSVMLMLLTDHAVVPWF